MEEARPMLTTHISTSGGLISAAFLENVREAGSRQRGVVWARDAPFLWFLTHGNEHVFYLYYATRTPSM